MRSRRCPSRAPAVAPNALTALTLVHDVPDGGEPARQRRPCAGQDRARRDRRLGPAHSAATRATRPPSVTSYRLPCPKATSEALAPAQPLQEPQMWRPLPPFPSQSLCGSGTSGGVDEPSLDERILVPRYVASLPEDQCPALVSRVIGKRSDDQIASELRCSDSVIRSSLVMTTLRPPAADENACR